MGNKPFDYVGLRSGRGIRYQVLGMRDMEEELGILNLDIE